MTHWLRRMLGLRRPDPNPELVTVKERSDAVLAKASRVIVEKQRIESMRASFRRADQRLAR